MNKLKLIFAFCFMLSMITLVACGDDVVSEDASEVTARVTTITALEAELMMLDDVIIVDVRNQDEFVGGHIPGAILLPAPEIRENAERMLPDKNQVILVYCRSGARSAAAARELVSLGYTEVYDFGGILDWHGEIVGG
ncbi:MAG: rhodanese-like domain-containing protein [Oscillospiraceae bacterium]|nr:rhodanese-like domain-containing protein [Oscillospiraceae bacterium]